MGICLDKLTGLVSSKTDMICIMATSEGSQGAWGARHNLDGDLATINTINARPDVGFLMRSDVNFDSTEIYYGHACAANTRGKGPSLRLAAERKEDDLITGQWCANGLTLRQEVVSPFLGVGLTH